MKKRSIALLLALMMAANLCACQGSTEQTINNKEDSDNQSETDMGENTTQSIFWAASEKNILFSNSFEDDEIQNLQLNVSEGAKGIGTIVTEVYLDDDRTPFVNRSSIFGSDDNGDESKDKLFDANIETKFLTFMTPDEENPVEIGFSTANPCVITSYLIASANDEPTRDPKAWSFYGSNDGNEWVLLDQQSNISFTGRHEQQIFSFNNTESYGTYKLLITENMGGADCTQLASLEIGNSDNTASESTDTLTLSTVIGPTSEYGNQSGKAWDGTNALEITGFDTGSGDSYVRNVLFDNLSVEVGDDTSLSYLILPSSYGTNGYDYEYLNMHFIIDLEFSDGTKLSDSSYQAVDQYGTAMDPDQQALQCTLYSNQWNEIICKLGDYASGKTINKVVLYYKNTTSATPLKFRTYIDKLTIYNQAPNTYAHLSDYVNILRGTNATGGFSRGLVCPGVTYPQGFNFVSPITVPGSNQPYYYSSTSDKLYCLSTEHMASNWVGDNGTWEFMANTTLNASNGIKYEDMTLGSNSKVAASFSHDNEIAKAHYYAVTLDEDSPASDVKIETTATDHGVYVRMNFPEDAENVSAIFDCFNAPGSFKFSDDYTTFTATSDDCTNGSNTLYVYGTFIDCKPTDAKVVAGQGAIATFAPGTKEVIFKFATSYISNNQAKHNLDLEIPEGKSFDDIYLYAQKTWDDLLGIVEISAKSEEEMITFYSNMYRLYAYPTSYCENQGTNEEPDIVHSNVYNNGEAVSGYLYANNGFWDTYRTTWVAYGLLTPSLDTQLLNGIVQHANDNNGWIPRWLSPAGTNSMVGTSSDIIFADAIAKGIEFNQDVAYQSALLNGAAVSSNLTNGGRLGLEHSKFLGYTPLEDDQGLSWSLEGYINDYGVAQMALARGDFDNYEYYINRCLNYVNLFNDEYGFFIGRNKNGESRYSNGADYNPHAWWGDYTETSGWGMAFTPVFDGNGLAALYGGRDKLEEKLDTAFSFAPSELQAGSIHEMVEAREIRMGEFHLSNQPSHHIPYMYAYAGAPYKTAEVVHEALNHCFVGSSIGQGYPGDEDNGEMSGWYILSALGLYPLNLGSGEYVITTPLYENYTLHLESGDIKVSCENFSKENIYIQSMTIVTKDGNTIDYTKNYITHEDLLNAKEIKYVLSDTYDVNGWGTAEGDLPTSVSASATTAPTPASDVTKGLTIDSKFNASAKDEKQLWTDVSSDDLANLNDDTSTTSIDLENDTSSFYFYDPEGVSVSVYTISNTKSDSMPNKLALYGSTDGNEWVELDSRENISVDYNNYTTPFAVAYENRAVYNYYRLDISKGNVSEIELLANKDVVIGSFK